MKYTMVEIDKSGVVEGIKELIVNTYKGKIFDVRENHFKFQIGTLMNANLGLPHFVEGSMNFKTQSQSTQIYIIFGRSMLAQLLIIQTIIFLLLGSLLSIAFGVSYLFGAILVSVAGNLLDFYYLIKLEQEFVKSVVSGSMLIVPINTKLVYFGGIIIIVVYIVVSVMQSISQL